MDLPIFWRRATFSVAETADLIRVPIETLRTWLMREPTGDHAGAKTGHRLFLSGNDAFFYLLVKEFTEVGTPVRSAMGAAHGIASWTNDHGLPPEKYLVLRRQAASTKFAHTDSPEVGDRPAIVIPLHTLAEQLVERASAIYLTEAA